jgi:hypothetical protein
MLKKIFGIVLMSIALLLTLGAIGLLANIVKAFVGVYFIFSGNLDSYAQGEAIGRLLYWIAHIAITYVFLCKLQLQSLLFSIAL